MEANFCHRNEWLDKNPLATAKKRGRQTKAKRLAENRKPGILAPQDVERFMNAMADVRTRKPGTTKANPVWLDHDFVSFWALKVFAGLRDAEAAAIGWKSIGLGSDRAI